MWEVLRTFIRAQENAFRQKKGYILFGTFDTRAHDSASCPLVRFLFATDKFLAT